MWGIKRGVSPRSKSKAINLFKHLFMKDIHGYILKGDDKTYQNIDTKVTMSEHDYNFLSTYQKSRMKVYEHKSITGRQWYFEMLPKINTL